MADTIATKYTIEGDSSGAQKAFRDLANLSDNFQKGLKNAGNSIKDFWKKNKKTFSTMSISGGAAFGAILVGAKNMIDAYAESEKAMARFNSVMATTGKWSEEASKKILALADAHVQLWFDDEDSAESLAKFYQRTKDVTEATKLNAIAMDLARAKSIGLSDASNLVGQVLSGNGKLLKQYGIDIDDTKSPLEALGELHTKVKWQAEAFANTYAGRMEIFNVQMGNLKEILWWPLAEVATNLLKSISPLVEKFGDFVENNPELVQKIVLIGGAFAGLVAAIWSLWLALPAIGTWIAFLSWPIGIVIGLVTLLWTAWATNFLGIGDKTAEVWNWIKEKTQAFVEGMQEIWRALMEFWKVHWDGIKLYFTVWLESIATGFKIAWDLIIWWLKIAWEILSTTLSIAFDLFKWIIVTWLQILSGDWSGAWETIKDTFSGIMEKMDQAANNILGHIKETFLNIWNDIKSGVMKIVGAISDYVNEKLESIRSVLQKIKDTAREIATLGAANTQTYNWTQPARASGGPVVAGRAYTVGEYGRETFVPASGGYIANASDTARASQNITIEINNPSVRSDMDIQSIADAVENVFIKKAKNFTLWIA